MSDLRELYQEVILDHGRNPRNFGPLEDANREGHGHNPLCGDKLSVYFTVDDDGRIEQAAFRGTGCAISVASASLLTEKVTGMSTDEALSFFESLVARLTGGQAPDADIDLGHVHVLVGIGPGLGRRSGRGRGRAPGRSLQPRGGRFPGGRSHVGRPTAVGRRS